MYFHVGEALAYVLDYRNVRASGPDRSTAPVFTSVTPESDRAGAAATAACGNGSDQPVSSETSGSATVWQPSGAAANRSP